jgi:hypothetical protein
MILATSPAGIVVVVTSDHVGKAGQLAAMAELLLRGYNVAMPEVDRGDDIFVVENDSGQLWRIQVKTAIGKRTRTGWRAKYSIAFRQIETVKTPDLNFVLALRREASWEFLLFGRKALFDEVDQHQVGSHIGPDVLLTVSFQDAAVLCSRRNWQAHRNNWSAWSIIEKE